MTATTHFFPTSHPTEAAGKKHRKSREHMKQEDQFRLYDWVKQPDPFKDTKGVKNVVDLAAKELGCFVSESGMIKACKVAGVEIPTARSENPTKRDRAYIIAQQVKALCEELNVPMAEDFLAVCNKSSEPA